MANAEKIAAVAELAEELRSSDGVVLTEYRGLSVARMSELRTNLGDSARFAVVKNTLTKIAADRAGMGEHFDELLQGPCAITFVKGDVVEAAKGLRDFSKANPQLAIKGGFIEGKPMTPAEITKLADLESRGALLSKLAGTLQAPLAKAAALFDQPATKTARLADALRAKREESSGEQAPAAAAQEAAQEDA